MLQFILGRSGFGKTHLVLERIAADVARSQSCMLLVPEQASFETERMLLRRLGEADAAKVQVLSFTRLCETLMEKHTALSLSNGAKILLMHLALEQTADSLSAFADARRADTVEALLELEAECRQSAVSPSVLASAAELLPEGTLKQKTTDLSLVLEAYEALIAVSGKDPQESLSLLAAHLNETKLLSDTTVYVDGFKSFTAPEMDVLTSMMATAPCVQVALCTDREHDESGGMDRFFVVIHTLERLRRAAAEVGCAVAKSELLMTPYRFDNDTLCALEATAFTSDMLETPPSDAVTLVSCSDIYEESAYVVQRLRRLMRTEGLRARDVALVARNLTEYIGVLDVALEQADIPYFLDRRTSIASEGVVTTVLTALKVAVQGWRTDSVMQLIKSGLLGFCVTSASRLEDYVFTWNLTGARFKEEWRAHPRGFVSSLESKDEARLSHLNRLRRRLVGPLVSLSKALAKPVTGEEFARALYRYIVHARIDRMTRHMVARLQKNGETALAEHTVRVWDALMGILNDMAHVLGEHRISGETALELFRAAAIHTDIGSIPQSMDAVQIGAADRMRFAQPKVVFLLGANEGIFPSLPTAGGLLSDRERRRLMDAGVPFEEERAHHASAEMFSAYSALAAATSKVYVSFLQTTPAGERGEPSSICHTVTAHLPFVQVQAARQDDGSDIETTREAFERMAGDFRAKTPLSRALYATLRKDESLRGRLNVMTRMAEDLPIAFEDSAVAKRFFGERMVLSASKVERYHQCRFSYFCEYGLGAKARRSAELGAIEFGTLTHYVMEHTLPVYIAEGIKTIKKARCFDDAKTASIRFVEEEMGGFEDKNDRFCYLLERLQGVCGNFLWQAVRELSQSHFVPVDYELDIALDEKDPQAVSPMVMTLEDGAQIAMIGKVDRVDLYDNGHTRYIRVVDYKTGSKDFRLEDVVEGINLQMLIYMMTLWHNGTPRYGEVVPAGLLYMPSKTPVVKLTKPLSASVLEKKQMTQMGMNGLLLKDEQVLAAMETGLEGIFIPASLKKDGTFSSKSSVATLAQFGALGRRARRLLEQMAQTLREGDVDARPYQTKKNDPCRYCDFRAICGHEEEDRVRERTFDNAEAVLAALDAEEEENA